MSADETIYAALDRAIAEAAKDEASLVAARAEWDRLAGVVHDDEPLYEERAAAFLEWFALDRKGAAGVPPIAQLLDGASPAMRALAATHRSLFRVRAREAGGFVLDDLWGGARFRVGERRRLAGIVPGELFEARLVADLETPAALRFTRGFCFHPREALGPVRRLVASARRAGESRDETLFRLLRLRVRCERWRHVSPERIYGAGEGAIFDDNRSRT